MGETAVAKVVRDYTGFATAQFKEVFWKYLDCDFEIFAERIGWHERDLKNIVKDPTYGFVGLSQADEILLGLGQNLSHLVDLGELVVIPARDSHSGALKMVKDEPGSEYLTYEEIEGRIEALRELRRQMIVLTDEQVEHLKRTAKRDAERAKRLREADA